MENDVKEETFPTSEEDEFDTLCKANPIWRRNFGVIMSSTLPNEAIGNMGDNIPGEIIENIISTKQNH